MTSRRPRPKVLPSPLTLLGEVEPAYRALCGAAAQVDPCCPHAEVVERAREALARLAADLGHEGRFSARAP